MKGVVRIVARPGTSAGFALTGIPVLEAGDGVEAGVRLRECLEDEGIEAVLVEESLHGVLPDEVRRLLARRETPVVVPVPAPSWEEPAEGEGYIVELLRRAIGYRIRM